MTIYLKGKESIVKIMSTKVFKITTLVLFIVIVYLVVLIINKPIENSPIANNVETSTSSVLILNSTTTTKTSEVIQPLEHYIEITNSCGPYYNLTPCVNMRSGPGIEYPVVDRLRNGIVLKVENSTIQGEYSWHKIIFDKQIHYPERVKGDWYVAVDEKSVLSVLNIGDEIYKKSTPTTSKSIVVELSKEMLYAYDGETLFMKNAISTGLDSTPTPIGNFRIFKKTPSRYMQGPIEGVSSQYFDLPGVPWNMYFTNDGDVIHGAYWHDNFGKPWSHGCVNLPPEKAKELYMWADVGTVVIVKE